MYVNTTSSMYGTMGYVDDIPYHSLPYLTLCNILLVLQSAEYITFTCLCNILRYTGSINWQVGTMSLVLRVSNMYGWGRNKK